MRQVAPRLVLEAVPLAEEVVPAVIADLGDLGMHHRHLRDVRSIDDHLAAVGDDRLQLVKALRRCPDVLLLGRHDREHPSYRCVEVSDMGLGCNLSARGPGVLRSAEGGGMQRVGSGGYDQTQRQPIRRNERCRLVDQPTMSAREGSPGCVP